MDRRIPVGILGATGTVGQRFVARLADHPDFRIAALAASEKSAGKRYGEACRWRLAAPAPAEIEATVLRRAEPDLPCEIVFSALDAETAREIEPRFAAAGRFVFSNASAHRMEEDVPLLVPEVNAEHAALLPAQRERRGWTGGLVTNPNCSATELAMALAPLDRSFGVVEALVTTMQAVSGAGYPGVPSLDALGNIIPDIPGEAGKIESETRRILGRFADGRVVPAEIRISASTYRVPVEEGHTQSVSVRLARKADAAALVSAWNDFRGTPEVASLPSAPPRPIRYLDAPQQPQPRPWSERDGGMVVYIGGLRRCSILDWKFTVVASNTVRGAAGGSVLNAELLLRQALLRSGP